MLRIVLFILSIILLSISVFELNRRSAEARLIVLEDEPLDKADSLLSQQLWQEAAYLSSVVRENPELGDTAHASSIELAANAALESLPINSVDFLQGMISGEANNGSALLGALALDLFVIGDIRDLLVQGYKELSNQDGDTVILALSATGLSLALLPELHWAPAVMKSYRRSRTFSEPFNKALSKLAKRALETANFKPLANLVSDFAKVTSKLGLAPSKGAISAVHTVDDLKFLSKSAQHSPSETYTLAYLSGQRGIKRLSAPAENAASLVEKLKISSRLAKTAKKYFASAPISYVYATLALSLALLVSAFRIRRKTALGALASRP